MYKSHDHQDESLSRGHRRADGLVPVSRPVGLTQEEVTFQFKSGGRKMPHLKISQAELILSYLKEGQGFFCCT